MLGVFDELEDVPRRLRRQIVSIQERIRPLVVARVKDSLLLACVVRPEDLVLDFEEEAGGFPLFPRVRRQLEFPADDN